MRLGASIYSANANKQKFGYAGKIVPNDQQGPIYAAYLVKNGPTPVGVRGFWFPVLYPSPQGPVQSWQPYYQVVTNNEYWQAANAHQLIYTA